MAKKKGDKEEKKPTGKKPTKKKRKVGRPKKRGRKKKYYKKRKKKTTGSQGRKGFGSNVSYNRVRSLLWQKHKDDFASYRDFISSKVDADGNKIKGSSIVSQVYDECKSLDCTDEDILVIYRQSTEQSPDEEKPELPSDYYEPRPYWELLTVDLWDGMDERLWVDAPMLIINPSYFLGILGEDRCVGKNNEILPMGQCELKKDGEKVNKDAKRVLGKKNRFQPFVDACNKEQLEATAEGQELGSDVVPHVRFVGQGEESETYWNPIEKRWEIELIICTPNGDRHDYGFNPSDDVPDIDMDEIPEPEEPEEMKEEEESTAVEKAKVEEIKKTGQLERLEMKKKGIMDEVKLYKDIGEKKEMADAIKRLKAVNKEIDKLT